MKTTILEYAILGLLNEEERSGYRIRKAFEETAMGHYSSSPGSIYPALKRLEANELICKQAIAQSTKEQFQIMPAGMNTLKSWLKKPLTIDDVSKRANLIFLRFAFMEKLLTRQERIDFLISFRDLLATYINDLENFHQTDAASMPLHGRLAFEYGIGANKTMLNWCEKILLIINEEQHDKNE